MASFTGMKMKAAAWKLKRQDKSISIQWIYKYSDKVKKGKIISQSIAKGTKYSEGTYQKIVFTVSKGKKKVSVSAKTKAPAQIRTRAPTQAAPRKNTTTSSKKQTGKSGIEFEGAIP